MRGISANLQPYRAEQAGGFLSAGLPVFADPGAIRMKPQISYSRIKSATGQPQSGWTSAFTPYRATRLPGPAMEQVSIQGLPWPMNYAAIQPIISLTATRTSNPK
jgi:hypothetical protein